MDSRPIYQFDGSSRLQGWLELPRQRVKEIDRPLALDEKPRSRVAQDSCTTECQEKASEA